MLPGDISGVQYEAVGGEHSHAVTRVINAGCYVVTDFRLRIIVSVCSVDSWLEERPQLPGGGRRTVPHLVWGLFPRVWCGCGAVHDVARPRHRSSPQARVGRCARVEYWRLDACGKGSIVNHCQYSFGYTVVLGAVYWRELLLGTTLAASVSRNALRKALPCCLI